MVFADITRKQAFLTHLLISMAIFFVLLYLIVFKWFPAYYFHIDGGYRGIVTIFFVDVVLGPGLTLLLFKPGKPRLKFDMTAIVIIQAIALTWGIVSVYTERPALTVFYDGEFTCLKHSDVSEIDLERLKLDDKGPPFLAVLPRPNTYAEYQAMTIEALRQNSASIYIYSEKFLPMDIVGTVQVMNYKLDVAESFSGSEADVEIYKNIWSAYLAENPDAKKQYLFYPLSCRYDKVLAVFDPEKSEIIDFVFVYTHRPNSNIALGFTQKELEEFREQMEN